MVANDANMLGRWGSTYKGKIIMQLAVQAAEFNRGTSQYNSEGLYRQIQLIWG